MLAPVIIILAAFGLGGEQPAPTQTAALPQAKEKKVCRDVASTGSHMTHLVCRTKTDWETIDRENAADVEKLVVTGDGFRPGVGPN